MELAGYQSAGALPDGTPVWVRAIRPDDRDTLGAAFARLSERSVYHRFFQTKTELSERELRYLTELDFVGHVGLFVLRGDAGSRELMGVARFIRLPGAAGRDRAEVAFTVGDGYQGRGVATLLLRHLILLASRVGIRYFEADVLPDNKAMLKVFEHSGAGWSELARDRMIRVTLDLSGFGAGAADMAGTGGGSEG
jgi:RimJ/RimL family protein N-acetyltransferase